MMKSIRTRLTVTYIALVAVMVMAIWAVNHFYLETYYINDKVQSLNEAYTAIDRQIEANEESGVSIEEAMRQEQDSSGNITEGNLRRLIREFSDKTNVSILMIDNSSNETALYSTARDAQLLKSRVDRYIFGRDRFDTQVLEEYENYKIQQSFDPFREGMYLESWGFFSDNTTAFIMTTPLSSIRESVGLSNRFLGYVGLIAAVSGAMLVYVAAKSMTAPINDLSSLSEKMSRLDFDVKFAFFYHLNLNPLLNYLLFKQITISFSFNIFKAVLCSINHFCLLFNGVCRYFHAFCCCIYIIYKFMGFRRQVQFCNYRCTCSRWSI